MNVSAPFIKRPVATTLLAVAVVLAGGAAYTQLPVAPLPRVDNPTINVGTGLPGGSPETMASAVATPLERRFGRIAGVNEITSSSTLGQTSLTLQFDLDRDVDSAARDVQAAINAAGGDLPAGLPNRPNYRKVNPADAPILIVALTSKTLPLSQMFDVANTILAQKISQVDGVGQVFVGGAQQPAVRVSVDPGALAGVGLSLEDVRAALSRATANSPKGSFSGALQTRSIDANDQLTSAAGYRPLVLAWQNGSPVRLGDVATVIDDVENQRAAAWCDGERAVLLIIRRQPGANIIEVIERVKALLPDLARSISPAIDVKVALDRSTTIRASVHDVQISLLISVALVVLVVFVFLRSVWATTIPTVAVPLSLIGTFGVMYLFGYSLDNLSLMALTISTGFVVDDAIVVTENVSRYVEQGDTPLQAAFKGARQIGFTIVSITASLLAVFIPILLMGGVVGRLFREFAVTLSIAIAMSAIVSLTLTPMMASRLLRGREERKRGRLDRISERALGWMHDTYDQALGWVLDHEKLMLLVTVATVAFTLYLYAVIPKGLFPQQDTGSLAGFSEAPQDVSFRSLKNRQEALLKILAQDPNIDHFVSFIGQGNTGTIFVQLKPWGVRKLTADQVIGELRPKAARVPGIQLFLQNVQDVRLGGRSSRTQYQYTVVDANLDELNEWAPRVLARLKTLPELRDVATDQQTQGLRLDVAVDRDTAAKLGVTQQAIDDTLYDAFGQRQVATIYTQLNQYRVVLEVKPEFQARPDQLEQLYVRTASGDQVPLGILAKMSQSQTALSVNHQGQFPAVTLSFNLAAGVALGTAVNAINKATLDIGLPAAARGSFQGTAQAFQQSLASEPFLIAFALIAVYIVLGVLYESYVHPVTILSTLPSAGVGALLALLATSTDFSIIALIGIILLIGIVKKNAIMMIDFAIEAEREEALTPKQAIHKACLLRFRPIMMTTLAALLGGVPLAIGRGAGAELRQPLGIAIVGGLLFSQMLTLFTTPVVYVALDRLSRRKRAHAIRAEAELAT
ncbi:MAG TPA: multidrug efflux RND transporter permease subunit [Myxococcales bacterium]|nr:multidrug efflux RND transporter permease subunit [Myxococcales bacterium]